MKGPGQSPRNALVTGVSRRAGIGFAVACALAATGHGVFAHHFAPHDAEQPWGGEPGGLDEVSAGIEAARRPGSPGQLADGSADLSESGAPERLTDHARAALGHLDILICNHALGGPDGGVGALDAELLDRHWRVNTRSSLLLCQAFAAAHDRRSGGRIILMTSGQGLGPMPGEVAYAASKGALEQVTATLADQLAPDGITVNCVNPGPVDTGWATEDQRAELLGRFPRGRWGEPADVARLICWLASEEAEWVTGQVISTEGGFRRA